MPPIVTVIVGAPVEAAQAPQLPPMRNPPIRIVPQPLGWDDDCPLIQLVATPVVESQKIFTSVTFGLRST